MKKYRARLTDELLRQKLASHGAVAVRGVLSSGKSSSARHFSRSAVDLRQAAAQPDVLELTRLTPSALLPGPVPRLLAEWQLVPELRDCLRDSLAAREVSGRFILTSSCRAGEGDAFAAQLPELIMRPLSLAESGESSAAVSLAALFCGEPPVGAACGMELEQLAHLLCRGGWPACMKLSKRAALRWVAEYTRQLVETEMSRADQIGRSSQRITWLLRAYARALGTPAKLSELVADIAATDGGRLTDDTAAAYIRALSQLYIVEEVPAWKPALQTRATLRLSATRCLADPSLGAAILRLSPAQLLRHPALLRGFFTNMCLRDLRVYASLLGGQLFHYRDKNGLDCDAVIQLPDGRYGMVATCLGGEAGIDKAARKLLRLEAILDTRAMGNPAFRLVLTAVGGQVCRRRDGVIILPLSALGA